MHSLTRNYYYVANREGTSPAFARYWTKKWCFPSFHNKQLGGPRRAVFQSYKLPVVFWTIQTLLSLHPRSRLHDVRRHLEEMFDHSLSLASVGRYLKKMGWSWRVPTRFQIYKYTIDNMVRYADYLTVVQTIPWSRLKFADEAHIVSKGLSNGRVLGLVNTRSWVAQNTLHAANATLTILTDLNRANHPLEVKYTEENNSVNGPLPTLFFSAA